MGWNELQLRIILHNFLDDYLSGKLKLQGCLCASELVWAYQQRLAVVWKLWPFWPQFTEHLVLFNKSSTSSQKPPLKCTDLNYFLLNTSKGPSTCHHHFCVTTHYTIFSTAYFRTDFVSSKWVIFHRFILSRLPPIIGVWQNYPLIS